MLLEKNVFITFDAFLHFHSFALVQFVFWYLHFCVFINGNTTIVSSAAILEHCVLIMQKVNLKEKSKMWYVLSVYYNNNLLCYCYYGIIQMMSNGCFCCSDFMNHLFNNICKIKWTKWIQLIELLHI